MSSKGKTSVGSPSARRLTPSTPAGLRDVRKRGNTAVENRKTQNSSRKKRIKLEDSSPNESARENHGSDTSTDVDPNSETDCEDSEKIVKPAATSQKKKSIQIESKLEEKPQSMTLEDALKNENNSEEELADRIKKTGRIRQG